MRMERRDFLRAAGLAAALPTSARAQGYPSRAVRMIVGWPPGGTSDILARLVTQSLAERLNQPFIVENRPGAGSNIAADAVVRAPADGYTLLLINAANASNAALYDKLSFNFIRDIVPVAGIYQGPFVVVVHPSVPASTIPELIAYAKANPGKLNMGSPGIGSTVHLAGELFKMMTGVDMVHVPYRGRPIFGLITGEVHVMFATIPGVIEHIRSGALRPLAVTTVMRSESLPGVPTVGDYVLGYEANDWYGVGAPAGTPKSIIEELHRVVNIALAGATLKARIADLGGTPLAVSQSELAQLVAEDTERWAKVVKFSGAKPD